MQNREHLPWRFCRRSYKFLLNIERPLEKLFLISSKKADRRNGGEFERVASVTPMIPFPLSTANSTTAEEGAESLLESPSVPWRAFGLLRRIGEPCGLSESPSFLFRLEDWTFSVVDWAAALIFSVFPDNLNLPIALTIRPRMTFFQLLSSTAYATSTCSSSVVANCGFLIISARRRETLENIIKIIVERKNSTHSLRRTLREAQARQ